MRVKPGIYGKSEGTGRERVLPFIEGLVDARHFTFCEVADEELETMEVIISNNIPCRECQNLEFNLVHPTV